MWTKASCKLTEYLTKDNLNVVPFVPPICIWSVEVAFVVGILPVTSFHSLSGKSVKVVVLVVAYSLNVNKSPELPFVLLT